ncbi:serine hydrolase [Streptomyces sp. NPDC048577]|uniref:D-alanyl-D-alanine carboxypeptidase family protein n=1 Tax=Streptomyces sp. NPDC048577 TaxID=3157209 RepID=UPI003416572F
MIVTSAVRHAVVGATALLLALPAPVASASSVAEPTPPAKRFVDPTRLYRSGTQVQPLSDAPDVPSSVSALSWVVADAGSGEVLAAHDAHRRLPPASTLKTLFAVTALPRLPHEQRHTVIERELEGIGAGSSLVGVQAGYTYKVSDLWNGVFLSSGNDAVHVLAAMNGGWESVSRQMQAKAKALGARDTRVVSPDGYDAPGQVSSAYDLAVFGRAGLQDPAFVRYCSTRYAQFPSGSWSYGIRNTNRLVTGEDGVERYPGIIGVKNGYTSGAGNTLIAAARRGARTLVVSVMNPQRGGGLSVYEEARSLLDWGFEAAGHVRPVGSLGPAPAKEAEKKAAPLPSRPAKAAAGATPAAAGPEASTSPTGGATASAAGSVEAPPARVAALDAPGAEAPSEAPWSAAAPAGPWAGLPPALVGSALAAALTLWVWRRRTGRRDETGA